MHIMRKCRAVVHDCFSPKPIAGMLKLSFSLIRGVGVDMMEVYEQRHFMTVAIVIISNRAVRTVPSPRT